MQVDAKLSHGSPWSGPSGLHRHRRVKWPLPVPTWQASTPSSSSSQPRQQQGGEGATCLGAILGYAIYRRRAGRHRCYNHQRPAGRRVFGTLHLEYATNEAASGATLQQEWGKLDGRISVELQQQLHEARAEIERRATSSDYARAEVEVLSSIFPYDLDEVQLEASRLLADRKDVVCCMPTGTGKTAIAVLAALRALLHNRRLFYTTPLKALSAQKLREFQVLFGQDAVGLVTGDEAKNADAPIVIMTTEIFRNAMYRRFDQASQKSERDERAPGESLLQVGKNVEAVVFDELHWLSDPSRGTTWEESILLCPGWMQMLGLSATVGGNAQELCRWIEEVRAPQPWHRQKEGRRRSCMLITSNRRAVPARFYASGGRQLPRLFPLTDLEDGSASDGDHSKAVLPSSTWMRAFPSSAQGQPVTSRTTPVHGPPPRRLPEPIRTIIKLHRLQWLPCIYFAFSRKACDGYVQAVGRYFGRSGPLANARHGSSSVTWLSAEEKSTIESRLARFQQDFPEVQYLGASRQALLAGAASHHAGMLPAERMFVEELFEDGLLKVVFATETLAAGINMPARSVVLNNVEKRSAEGLRCLNGSEFLQMAGRAGRRGIDTSGHVVIGSSKSVSEADIRWSSTLLMRGAEPLRSRFFPSYEMICNMVARGVDQTRTEAELKALVDSSFAAFLGRQGKETSESESVEDDPQHMALRADLQAMQKARASIEEAGLTIRSIQDYRNLQARREVERQCSYISRALEEEFEDLLDAMEEAPKVSKKRQTSGVDKEAHELDKLPPAERTEILNTFERLQALRLSCSQTANNMQRSLLSFKGMPGLWPQFASHITVLCYFDFIKAQPTKKNSLKLSVTQLGRSACQASRGANPLWLGKALLPEPHGKGVLQNLGPVAVAAVVGAMCAEVSRADAGKGGRDDASEQSLLRSLPEDLQDSVQTLDELRWQLAEVQWMCGVFEPFPLSYSAMRCCLGWASGSDWGAVTAQASSISGCLDGDVYRIIRRAMEVLTGLSSTVRSLGGEAAEQQAQSLEEAVRLMDRSPISENSRLELGDELTA